MTGPASKELVEALEAKGFISKNEKGKIDPARLNALIFDQFKHGYYVSGEQVGKAWNAGAGLMKQ